MLSDRQSKPVVEETWSMMPQDNYLLMRRVLCLPSDPPGSLSMPVTPYLWEGQCQAQPWLSGACCLPAAAMRLLFWKRLWIHAYPTPQVLQHARRTTQAVDGHLLAAESKPWQCRKPDNKANHYHLFCPSVTSISLHSVSAPLHMFSTFSSCRIFTNARISGMFPEAGKRNNQKFICIYVKDRNWKTPQEIMDFYLPRCKIFQGSQHQRSVLPRGMLSLGIARSREGCTWPRSRLCTVPACAAIPSCQDVSAGGVVRGGCLSSTTL